VVGFTLMAVGSIITFVRQADQGYFGVTNSLRWDLEAVFSPLMTMVALWAWWWMSKIRVSGAEQTTNLRRALYGFSVQFLIYAVAMVTEVTSVHSFLADWWNLDQLWIAGLGATCTSLGFFVAARSTVDASLQTAEAV
jgi:hypothetical protein